MDHDPPSMDHDPPCYNHVPPSMDHDLYCMDHDPSCMDHDPACNNHDPSCYNHDLPSMDHDLYCMDHDPSCMDHDPACYNRWVSGDAAKGGGQDGSRGGARVGARGDGAQAWSAGGLSGRAKGAWDRLGHGNQHCAGFVGHDPAMRYGRSMRHDHDPFCGDGFGPAVRGRVGDGYEVRGRCCLVVIGGGGLPSCVSCPPTSPLRR
jgi:hypothetical protein